MREHAPILSLIEQAAQETMRQAAKATLKRARELAPRDTGALIKSGRVRVDDLTAQVVFTAPHARFVHEDLDADHPRGGGAKFLETAGREVDVEPFIQAEMQKRFS